MMIGQAPAVIWARVECCCYQRDLGMQPCTVLYWQRFDHCRQIAPIEGQGFSQV